MEQKVKAGDYVILTDPLSYGKRVKVKEVYDDGTIVYDGGVTPLYLKEPKELDTIAHPDYYNEKKYKDALEKLQEALAPKNGCEISGLTRGCIENIFPELKDERIRDMLLRHIQRARGSLTNDEAGECIEWLKKQGNKNLHEFAMPIDEVNNDYVMKQAEMLKYKHNINWEQRRYEIAKEVLTYCAKRLVDALNSGCKKDEWVGKTIQQIASESAVCYADALIERLKMKEEQE